jgi:hypothetical protein
MAKQIVRVRQRPATDFADQSEVNEADAPLLGSAAGRFPISRRKCSTMKRARSR